MAKKKKEVQEELTQENGEPALPPPPGVQPIYLTGGSVENFHLKFGEDLTEEQRWKDVTVEDLKGDMQFRGAISDFHCIKDIILAYKQETMTIVYDLGGVYGHNYYICIKPDAAIAQKELLAPQKPASAEAGGGEEGGTAGGEEGGEDKPRTADSGAGSTGEAPDPGPQKPKESRPWVSMGSESEIAAVTVVPNRDLLVMGIARKRKEFGAPYKFTDRDSSDNYNEFRPYRDQNFALTMREQDLGIQHVLGQIEKSTQTLFWGKRSKVVQYSSLEMSTQQASDTQNEVEFVDFLQTIQPRYEAALQQNETFDLFEDVFANLAEDDTSLGNKQDNAVREFQSFTDIMFSKNKRISAIDWQPENQGVVACSCTANLTLDERVEIDGKVNTSHILIWGFVDPIHPQSILELPGDVFTFRFNPLNADQLVAGCINGQIFLFDLTHTHNDQNKDSKSDESEESSKQTVPITKYHWASTIEGGHKCFVSDLCWLPSNVEMQPKTGIMRDSEDTKSTHQFVTIAADGHVLFWDARIPPDKEDFRWNPIYGINMATLDGTGELGGCQFALTSKLLETKFFCTTEEGELVHADWKPAVDGEDHPDHILSSSTAHYGPVHSLCRSPFFEDIYLTVGDWTFNIWKMGVLEPILSSPHSFCYLTAGRWSPTRAGVLVMAKSDGSIDIWDLLDRSHEPSMVHNISSDAVTSLEFWPHKTPQLLAIGDSHAVLHIMEIPRNLSRAVNAEKSIMKSFFEREEGRVEYTKKRLEFRKNELIDKRREQERTQESAEAAAAVEAAPAVVIVENPADSEEAKNEEAYQKMELAFKRELGLLTEEEGEASNQPPGF